MRSWLLAIGVLFFAVGCASEDEQYTEAMAEEHADDSTQASPMVQEPMRPVETRTVAYADGEAPGFLAIPEGADPDDLPALIVIHEWWGLNDNIRAMTRRLAGEGYAALAVDLYGGRVAASPEQARDYMGSAIADMGAVRANLVAAHAYLADELGAEAVGSIGWCFGGGMALQTGLALPDELDALVIYYGRLVTEPDDLRPLDMPILGLFGALDQGIPVEQVRAFEAALAELDKEAEIHVYEGAGHAFANPTGDSYQAEAAEDAWARTVAFLNEHLKSEG